MQRRLGVAQLADPAVEQRVVIVLAGPAMNVLFPVLLYVSVSLGDREFLPPSVGVVLPGKASEGKLHPDDVILDARRMTVEIRGPMTRQEIPRYQIGSDLLAAYQEIVAENKNKLAAMPDGPEKRKLLQSTNRMKNLCDQLKSKYGPRSQRTKDPKLGETIAKGERIKLNLQVSGGKGITGGSIDLRVDPKLRVVGVTASDYLTTDGGDLTRTNAPDGTLKLSFKRNGTGADSGTLVILELEGQNLGNAPVLIQGGRFLVGANPITGRWVNSLITVN